MANKGGGKTPAKAAPAKSAGKKSEAKKASPALPMPDNQYKRVSVSVEKISNGYLIHQSESDNQGFKDKTIYSKTKPVITMPQPKGPKAPKAAGNK